VKEYNYEKKKWIEKEPQGSLKKPKFCKGRRPHQMQIILPTHVKTTKNVSQETIDEYYQSEKRRYDFVMAENKMLERKGIIVSSWIYKPAIYLRCSVCGKKDYQNEK